MQLITNKSSERHDMGVRDMVVANKMGAARFKMYLRQLQGKLLCRAMQFSSATGQRISPGADGTLAPQSIPIVGP